MNLLCLLLSAAAAIQVGQRSRNNCNDGMFLIDKAHLVAREKAGKDACPSGYQLAKLDTKAQFNRAAYFMFSCLGPSKEAWIETAGEAAVPQGKIGLPAVGKNDPLKLIAPDAIEKGMLLEEGGRGNVRAYGQVTTEKATAKIPALCQKKEQ